MPTTVSRPARSTKASQSLSPDALAEIVPYLDAVEPDQVVVLDDRFGPDAGKNGGEGVARSRAALALKAIETAYPNYQKYLRTHVVEVEPTIFAPALSVRSSERKPRQVKPKTEAKQKKAAKAK